MTKNALTRLLALLTTLLLLGTSQSYACTGLLVGKNASADGSVMISYSADSHTLYGELYYWPAADHAAGSMRQITEWDSGKPLGQIPEVAHTYAVIGNMNEHALAITESTWGGREELMDPNGLMDYGSLIYVTLQRAKTAREAIEVMTTLAKEYGYASSGESISIADKNEAWVLELVSKGKYGKGAVWVAMRIPDNAISAHANQSRIQQIKFNDPENCLYAPDVIDFARERGFYKGSDRDFSFQKAYNPYTPGGLRGCEARVWAFFNKFSDNMQQYERFVMGDEKASKPMPLYVVPNRKLSVADVRDMMRDHYEGTPMDMTKDVGAGPYAVPYRWRPMTFEVDGQTYVNERAIATQQTGFVLVAQLRPNLPDAFSILWFGVDDANTALFTPVYCSSLRTPECYRVGNGDMMHFSWTSAFWIHNWVANMAYARYAPMMKDIRPVQQQLEQSFDKIVSEIDQQALAIYQQDPMKAREVLTTFSCETADYATHRWKKLGEYLLVKYMDGNMKKEENGQFKTNGYGMSDMPYFPGYDKAYYERIAETTGDLLKINE